MALIDSCYCLFAPRRLCHYSSSQQHLAPKKAQALPFRQMVCLIRNCIRETLNGRLVCCAFNWYYFYRPTTNNYTFIAGNIRRHIKVQWGNAIRFVSPPTCIPRALFMRSEKAVPTWPTCIYECHAGAFSLFSFLRCAGFAFVLQVR